jgi:hypothetical protein
LAGADRIWKVQAPGRCRLFCWLVLHGRCWTLNSIASVWSKLWTTYFWGCVHSRETWFRVLCYFGLDQITPQEELPYFEWWLDIRKQVHKSQRKGFDSLTLLVIWSLWKERNWRVHERVALQPVLLAPRIMEEARRWTQASFVGIGSLGRRRL